MDRTFLGMGGRPLADLVPCDEDCDRWDWNSRYWREFGAPWGTYTAPWPTFLQTFLDDGGRS